MFFSILPYGKEGLGILIDSHQRLLLNRGPVQYELPKLCSAGFLLSINPSQSLMSLLFSCYKEQHKGG